jgi:hypothetical protein
VAIEVEDAADVAQGERGAAVRVLEPADGIGADGGIAMAEVFGGASQDGSIEFEEGVVMVGAIVLMGEEASGIGNVCINGSAAAALFHSAIMGLAEDGCKRRVT